MNSSLKIPSLAAAALCAAAVVPATAGAGVERGDYFGKTDQAAGKVRVDLGILSTPVRVVRIELKAKLACPDGSSKDARYGKVIAFGPQLNGKGNFRYVDGGLSFQGKIGTEGKARGTFSYTVGDCSVAGVKWTAKIDD